MSTPQHRPDLPGDDQAAGKPRRGRLLMLLCCVPMLVIAVLIVLRGAGLGFLLIALLCVALMAAMMGMSHGPRDG